jgi:hypothetical protein
VILIKDSERSFWIPKREGLRVGCKSRFSNVDAFEHSSYLSTAIGVVEHLNICKSLGN